jgi:hypothetical protein
MKMSPFQGIQMVPKDEEDDDGGVNDPMEP